MLFATSTLSLFLYGEAYPRPTASGCRRHPASARDASPSTSGGERPMWFRSFLLGALGYNILFAFPELAFLSRTPRKSRTRVGTGKGGFRIPNVPCSFCERRTSDKKAKPRRGRSKTEQGRRTAAVPTIPDTGHSAPAISYGRFLIRLSAALWRCCAD